MMGEWRRFYVLTKIFCIGGLISFLGLAIMILTGITGIGAILVPGKRCVLETPKPASLAYHLRV